MNRTKSEDILKRAQAVMPGGVSSPVRSFRSVGGGPLVAARGDGPHLYDEDGNKFIDLVCSWGALIHGHNHPRIREMIHQALSRGTSFGATSEAEIKLCEIIQKCLPNLEQSRTGQSRTEMIRLVNSGTEACMSAIRLARGITQKEMIVKCEGHYHGHADSFLISAGSGVAELSVASSHGIPEAVIKQSISTPFNDVEKIKKIFEQKGHEIACVILEVVPGNMGVVLPEPNFLRELRHLTKNYGALLIFDEVITGFRLSLGGAQPIYGIEPDLVCLGKIIGGGLPVGAYGGPMSFMKEVAPLGGVYQAGTLSGNPLAAAAGTEALTLILEDEKSFYQKLDSSGASWKSELFSHIKQKGYPVSIVQIGSMLSLFFRPTPPKNFQEVQESNREIFNRFFWSLFEQGIFWPPSPFEACFLSSAHDEKTMDQVIQGTKSALDEAFQNG